MKQKPIGLSQRYVTALRQHLKPGPRAIPLCGTAAGLGRQSVALVRETLELARVHERALATLKLSTGKNGLIKRAEIFLNKAWSNTPGFKNEIASTQRWVVKSAQSGRRFARELNTHQPA